MLDPALREQVRALVRAALAEDLTGGDLTTQVVFPQPVRGRALLRAKSDLVLAGTEIGRMVFETLDPGVRIEGLRADGETLRAGETICRLEGDARCLLMAERVAINFMQRLSGIATLTARYVAAVKGFRARVVDTRKTTPGWRALEKYAVRTGGGANHRFSLAHGILIKDNHVDLLGSLSEAVRRAKTSAPHPVKIEVEARSIAEVREALQSGADVILLDNMGPEKAREAVELIKGRALIEASGGIDLSNIREMAAAGVDFIAVGALTHSAPAVDICLDIDKTSG